METKKRMVKGKTFEELAAKDGIIYKDEIKPGDIVRHFKGNFYQVLEFAHDSEKELNDENLVVVYSPLYFREGVKTYGEGRDVPTYTRPKKMFEEIVDREEYSYKGPRFRSVSITEGDANEVFKYVHALYQSKSEESLVAELTRGVISTIQRVSFEGYTSCGNEEETLVGDDLSEDVLDIFQYKQCVGLADFMSIMMFDQFGNYTPKLVHLPSRFHIDAESTDVAIDNGKILLKGHAATDNTMFLFGGTDTVATRIDFESPEEMEQFYVDQVEPQVVEHYDEMTGINIDYTDHIVGRPHMMSLMVFTRYGDYKSLLMEISEDFHFPEIGSRRKVKDGRIITDGIDIAENVIYAVAGDSEIASKIKFTTVESMGRFLSEEITSKGKVIRSDIHSK